MSRTIMLCIAVLSILVLMECSKEQLPQKQPNHDTEIIHSTDTAANMHKVNNDSHADFDIILPQGFQENDTNCVHKPMHFEDSMVYYLSRDSHTPHWSITTDYNGDSRPDYAGFAVCNDSILKLIAHYTTASAPAETVLFMDTIGSAEKPQYYLEFVKPGHIQGFPFEDVPDSETVADLTWPGIHLVFYETSSVLFYWKNGRFRELWTSD